MLAGDFNAWCGEINEFIENCVEDPVYNFNIDVFTSITLDTLGIQTSRLKEYYEIVGESRPLSAFFPKHADFFTEMHF